MKKPIEKLHIENLGRFERFDTMTGQTTTGFDAMVAAEEVGEKVNELIDYLFPEEKVEYGMTPEVQAWVEKSKKNAHKLTRCAKCNNPFEYHHKQHVVGEKVYHTGCIPKFMATQKGDEKPFEWPYARGIQPRDFKELIDTQEYEPWAKELLSKFFVYKFGEKFPDHVGAQKELVEFIRNLLTANANGIGSTLEDKELPSNEEASYALGFQRGREQMKVELKKKVKTLERETTMNGNLPLVHVNKGFNQATEIFLNLLK